MTEPQLILEDIVLRCSLAEHGDLPVLFKCASAAGWSNFIRTARREGLAGLIFHHCRENAASAGMPEEVAGDLGKDYYSTLARNAVFLEELEGVKRVLAGLDYIVLKGAFLAAHVYRSLGTRGFSDIDILVRREDIAEAGARLAQARYECDDRQIVGPDSNPFRSSAMYSARECAIGIDLHWSIANAVQYGPLRSEPDMSLIWTAAKSFSTAHGCGPDRLVLCPEHLLIHLADHALHHSFDRLILLRDMAEVLDRYGGIIDWRRLVADSVEFKMDRQLYYGLFLLSRKAGIMVPGGVLDALAPPRANRLEQDFLGMVLGGRRLPELGALAQFARLDTNAARAALIVRMLFPDRDLMSLIYARPAAEIGLGLYLFRLGRMARYALSAARGFFAWRLARAAGG